MKLNKTEEKIMSNSVSGIIVVETGIEEKKSGRIIEFGSRNFNACKSLVEKEIIGFLSNSTYKDDWRGRSTSVTSHKFIIINKKENKII